MMWNKPYLETCCRSALHRLMLSGKVGRPAEYEDGPCLARLAGLGLAVPRGDTRYEVTAAGICQHRRVLQPRKT
jgi:hypothetical protein